MPKFVRYLLASHCYLRKYEKNEHGRDMIKIIQQIQVQGISTLLHCTEN